MKSVCWHPSSHPKARTNEKRGRFTKNHSPTNQLQPFPALHDPSRVCLAAPASYSELLLSDGASPRLCCWKQHGDLGNPAKLVRVKKNSTVCYVLIGFVSSLYVAVATSSFPVRGCFRNCMGVMPTLSQCFYSGNPSPCLPVTTLTSRAPPSPPFLASHFSLSKREY